MCLSLHSIPPETFHPRTTLREDPTFPPPLRDRLSYRIARHLKSESSLVKTLDSILTLTILFRGSLSLRNFLSNKTNKLSGTGALSLGFKRKRDIAREICGGKGREGSGREKRQTKKAEGRAVGGGNARFDVPKSQCSQTGASRRRSAG